MSRGCGFQPQSWSTKWDLQYKPDARASGSAAHWIMFCFLQCQGCATRILAANIITCLSYLRRTWSPMEDSQFRFPWFDRRVWAVGGVLFLLLATAFVGLRAYKNFPEPSRQFDWESRGMSDFSSLYNYSKAFRDGANPYSSEIMDQPEYVLSRPAAPYSPVTFLPYVPLTYVPLEIAAATFFVFSWLMFGVLAWCCVRMSRIEFDWVLWVWVFAFLVFSRPGHITLFTGYFTVVSTLGTVVALHYAKSKPLLSGLGFLLATVKPTYAIPLTILMFARRDFKATISGVLLRCFHDRMFCMARHSFGFWFCDRWNQVRTGSFLRRFN